MTEKGDFLWQQIAGEKQGGARSLYVAMFDEIDEGTAIFKVKRENEVPVVTGSDGYKFVGIEEDLESDYYLWLTGKRRIGFMVRVVLIVPSLLDNRMNLS